jgi:hypothetical protein
LALDSEPDPEKLHLVEAHFQSARPHDDAPRSVCTPENDDSLSPRAIPVTLEVGLTGQTTEIVETDETLPGSPGGHLWLTP